MTVAEILDAVIGTVDGSDLLTDVDWYSYEFAVDDPEALADVYQQLLAQGEYTELDSVLAGFEAQSMADLDAVLSDEEFEHVTRGTKYE